MTEKKEFYLIVGLGNPGLAYAHTRHNIGFCALDALASKWGCSFRKSKGFCAAIAENRMEGKKVILLKPETYMNSSGEAVRACSSFYDIPLEQICVVCDDIYLPFGKIRFRAFGGDGGHNGLKSISTHLMTQSYPRLRIGVGDDRLGDLSDHVLGPFYEEEKQEIPNLVQRACDALTCWLGKGIIEAMQETNACLEKKRGD